MKIESVAIAMATYNGARYLAEQLDSLICQTYPIREISISDDASIDGTWEILSAYRKRYPGLIVLNRNEANSGFIKNFEKAIGQCTSEYIALCDQDDVWVPHKIEKLMSEVSGCDLVHSDAFVVDEDMKLLDPSFSRYSRKTITPSFIGACISNTVTGCTSLFHRSLYERATPFPDFLPHDHWLAILAMDGKGVRYCPEPLIYYRQHENNAIGAKPASATTVGTKGLLQLAALVLAKEPIYARRREKFKKLLAAADQRISADRRKELKKLVDYYDAYFDKSIRVRSFMFHAAHMKALSENKRAAQRFANLCMSAFGKKMFIPKEMQDAR